MLKAEDNELLSYLAKHGITSDELVKSAIEEISPIEEKRREEHQSYYGYGYGSGSVYSNTGPVPIFNGMYNGEKSQGELGAPLNLLPDHRALRFRAYEANLTSDIVKIITGKLFKWTLGNGLSMEAQPNEKLLRYEKINEDLREFKSNVEAYFQNYILSCRSDYSGNDNLNINALKMLETKVLGGDCLVVFRIDDDFNVTSQVIDGQHVSDPIGNTEYMQGATSRGHTILHGVEIDSKGRHIAYYVNRINANPALVGIGEYERIEAYSKSTGLRMARLVYGSKHRIDHVRGISMLSAILEKVAKLDRYTEATVATAEEHSKVVFQVVHGKTSDGTNPFLDGVRQRTTGISSNDHFAQAAGVAKEISVSENKQVHNMPQDSELKAVSTTSEINYEPFFRAIFNQICASVDIPPEIAMQMYNSNYSASRAAIKGWEFLIKIYRDAIVREFYQPFYDLWLFVHINKGKVRADGYLKAFNQKNIDVIEAYGGARFTGVNMPHIDPVKEMNAIRLMLGKKYDSTPLVSLNQATEIGGLGDWDENIKNVAEEEEMLEELDMVPTDPQAADSTDNPDATEPNEETED
jgi:capsid protein